MTDTIEKYQSILKITWDGSYISCVYFLLFVLDKKDKIQVIFNDLEHMLHIN